MIDDHPKQVSDGGSDVARESFELADATIEAPKGVKFWMCILALTVSTFLTALDLVCRSSYNINVN